MFAGIDLGSRTIKIVTMEENNFNDFIKVDTMDFYRKHGKKEGGRFVVDFSALDLAVPAVAVTATGYGRQVVRVKGARIIPEIQAHVLGALRLTSLSDFTLLDLGGQDSKVALVRGGRIVDFLTNDKCAASTGRYLENMAAVLKISLDRLGRHYRDPAELTSTCAIFGESELIGKVVEGDSIQTLAAGVNHSIFKRVKPMLVKLSSRVIVFTGGVAHNNALRKIIAGELGVEVIVPDKPEYAGAIGCCMDALEAGGTR